MRRMQGGGDTPPWPSSHGKERLACMGSEPSRPAGPPAARGAVALCLPLGRCVTPRCGAAHVLAVAAPMAGIEAHLIQGDACLGAPTFDRPTRRRGVPPRTGAAGEAVSGERCAVAGGGGSSGDIARWRAVAEGHPHAYGPCGEEALVKPSSPCKSTPWKERERMQACPRGERMTIRQLRDLLATMDPDGEALVTSFTPMALQRRLRLRMSPSRMAMRTSKSLEEPAA